MVATQDLQSGDELRRLKAETDNDFGEAMSGVVDEEAPAGSSVEVVDGARPSSKVVVGKECGWCVRGLSIR